MLELICSLTPHLGITAIAPQGSKIRPQNKLFLQKFLAYHPSSGLTVGRKKRIIAPIKYPEKIPATCKLGGYYGGGSRI